MKRFGIVIILGLILTFSCFSTGYGAGPIDNEEEAFSGEPALPEDNSEIDEDEGADDLENEIIIKEATLPVIPDQIDSSARGAGALSARSRFEAFNARHGHKWKANIAKKDGRVKILYGSMSRRYPGTPEEAALDFLRESHTVFGIREDLEDLKTLRTDRTRVRNHVKLQQTVDGVPVKAAFVLVHTNQDGQVSMVQNDYLQDLDVANLRIISREEAIDIALDDLGQTRGTEGVISTPKAQEMVVPDGPDHIFIWQVTIPTQKPYGLWVYHIDTENGDIRYVGNEIKSLKKGVGNVYKSNREWEKDNIVKTSLPYMYTLADGYAEGWLWGLHGDIYDYNGNNPYAPNLKFIYSPYIPSQKPWFDATVAYYRTNHIWKWWQKNVVKKYVTVSPDYFYTDSIPVVVNVDDTCNAFYVIDLIDGIPGLVFGNESSCAPTSEDLALDQDVFSHEYAHAMMDWCGFDEQFDSEEHQYGRAMGEGIADWFAYLYTNSPIMGDVAWAWSVDGYLRNLNNDRTYPEDVDDPYTGLPEEHYTGEIWGGYLYDVKRALKKKRAIQFIWEGLHYFTPAGGHMPTAPDFFDAIYAQILAEQDLHNGRYRSAAAAWGSMASRGINAAIRSPYSHPSDYFNTGTPGSDAVAYYAWTFPAVKRIKTLGRIFKTSATNEFPINIAEAGRVLRVKVKAKGANMAPALELRTTGNEPVATGTSTDTSAAMLIPDMPAGEYVILVSANQGPYLIDVLVK